MDGFVDFVKLSRLSPNKLLFDPKMCKSRCRSCSHKPRVYSEQLQDMWQPGLAFTAIDTKDNLNMNAHLKHSDKAEQLSAQCVKCCCTCAAAS